MKFEISGQDIIGFIFQSWMLYCVLAGYEVTEKSTVLQKINDSWEEELQAFLLRKRVGGAILAFMNCRR